MRLPAAASSLLNGMEPLGEGALAAIRAQHPAIAEDYLTFLRDVGFGGIGRDASIPLYMIYSGPIEPSWVYGREESAMDERYLLLGDDFCGNSAAFDRVSGVVVEIDHEDLAGRTAAENFSDFTSQLLVKLARIADGDAN